MHVLRSKPINFDNERAAIALIEFKEDEEVSKECLKMLNDPITLKDTLLATYLILACEGLNDPELRKEFKVLSQRQDLIPSLRKDIETIANSWDSSVLKNN